MRPYLKIRKIFDFLLFLVCCYFLYECLFLEKILSEQIKYYHKVENSSLQLVDKIHLADIPRDYIKLLSSRIDEEWSTNDVEIAQQLSHYKTYPIFYKKIIDYYEKKNDSKNYFFWRSKALHLIQKHQIEEFKKTFPKEKL